MAILGVALLVCATPAGAGQIQAAGGGRWSDRALQLSLSYPAGWSTVPEHGAALKLRAVDGKAEFEIFRVTRSASPAGQAMQATGALARLHCQVSVQQSSRTVGQLGVRGSVATGLCTGADRGWRLTITAFTHAGSGVLLRGWLYHAQPHDGAELATISASLSPLSP
jgi:hypothetical protein